jgi:hypothetical protein
LLLSNPRQDRLRADAVRPHPDLAQVTHLAQIVTKIRRDMERKRRLREEIRSIVREELAAQTKGELNAST